MILHKILLNRSNGRGRQRSLGEPTDSDANKSQVKERWRED
jgi:hypothetical protein